MNEEAGQKPQNVSKRNKRRDDLDPEKLKWLVWLYKWEGYFAIHTRTHSDVNPTQMRHQQSEAEPTVGKPWVQDGLRQQTIGGQHPGGPINGGDGHGVRFLKVVSNPGREDDRACDGGTYHLPHAHFSLLPWLQLVQTITVNLPSVTTPHLAQAV